MALGKNSLRDVYAAMAEKEFVAEVKFDGERCQVRFRSIKRFYSLIRRPRRQMHKIGDCIAYFSRRGIDQTDASSFGIFDAAVRRQIAETECVLDGELVVWNRDRCELPLRIPLE